MSDMINSAVAALTEKLSGGFDGSAKFVIEARNLIGAFRRDAGVRRLGAAVFPGPKSAVRS